LRHTDGAEAIEQRSHLIVPLIVQRDLLGYIYADIDGAFGRFHDGDRDLLAMLASQAAVALANVRFAAGLERKVAERTAELEQRAGELTIINSIQQGIAGSLDFQGIVDLVGDKAARRAGREGHVDRVVRSREPPGPATLSSSTAANRSSSQSDEAGGPSAAESRRVSRR
jgi:hypothetical protein